MTVENQTPINSYLYAGSATFPYSFQLVQDIDLAVTVDGNPKTLGVDYTVSGVGVQSGGSVTYTSALTTGQRVTLARQTSLERSTDYQTEGDFLALTVNSDFDRLWMALQDNIVANTSFIRGQPGETFPPLPISTTRASMLLGFDSAGNLTVVTPSAQSATALSLLLASSANGQGADAVGGVGRVVVSIATLKGLIKTGAGKAFVLGYYASGDGGGGQYYCDLADTTSSDNGGTIIVASDGGRWKLAGQTNISVKQFGAKGDGTTNDTAAIQAAINWGGCVYAKAGTYLHDSLSFIGKSVSMMGDGEDKTIFKANSAVVMFDVQETTDQALLPLAIVGVQLNGNGVATSGIRTRYRHKTLFANVTVKNVAGDGLNELDAWNNQRFNLTLNNNVNGLVLQGANNNSKYNGISAGANSGYQAKVLNGGTVPGGSTALSFDNSDFENATGFGVYINTTGVVRFNDCYIGEGIQGTVFDMAAGQAIVSGGVVQFGTLSTSYLGNLGGGKLLFKGVKIAGGPSATVGNMFTSGNGRASIEDSPAAITTTGAQVMNGDCLDYGKSYDCFAPKLGRQYTGFCLNGSFTSATTANELTVTCSTSTGAAQLEVHANVTRNWIDGGAGALKITYKSSQPCSVRLTQSPIGVTPAISITGTLPASSNVQTAVFYNWTYTLGVAPLILEIFQNVTNVGDTLTVLEVFLSDSKNTEVDGVATFYNMAKC